jgi:hypothetical protein
MVEAPVLHRHHYDVFNPTISRAWQYRQIQKNVLRKQIAAWTPRGPQQGGSGS